jgi:hypothetical protein
VNDALENFYSQTLLSPDVLLPNSLSAQIEAKHKFLQSSTVDSVLQLLQIVRTTTRSNALQTAIPMSTLMYRNITIGLDALQMRTTGFYYTSSWTCICNADHNCSIPSGFFNIDKGISRMIQSPSLIAPLENVPGFFVGCIPIESFLQSTLECLFDWSCLMKIRKFIPSSNIAGVYALDTSQTGFTPNMSIEKLISELFIEKWTMKPFFSHYYAQCAPILCTYTLSRRNNPLYVLTKLLGLYGGLNAVLRFCVPLIVVWWRKRRLVASTAEPPPSEYRYLKSPRLILLKL